MKRITKLFMFAAIVAAFAVPALAQSSDCTDEKKSGWYDTFLKNYKGELAQQKVAYDAAKQYLACSSDPSDQYAAYLKKFVDAMDKLLGAQDINKQFDAAYKSHNYPEQLRLGKQILANDQDNPLVNIIMGVAGLGEAKVLSDSAAYAKKAIALIEAGKSPAPYTKDQALAYLNWTVGKASLATAPADAIPNLLQAAKLNSEVNKFPQLYIDLAAAYENGPQAKLTEEYKSKQGPNSTETPESKLVLENLNQVIDRHIDALARAAALTTNAADKKLIMDDLTTWYKYRNKSENGLNELVASVLSKPVPDVPTPIISLPTQTTPTPGATPANGGATGTNGGTASGGAKTTGNGSASTMGQNKTTTSTSTNGTQTGSAKPSATPKPKPRRLNHRVAI